MAADQSKKLATLLVQSRERLRRIVRLRIDGRLQGRIDESDVIQEAYAEASQRFSDFDQEEECSPFIWLRFLTLQKLAQLHRHHFNVQARSVKKEVFPDALTPSGGMPAASSVMAREMIGNGSTPSKIMMAKELQQSVTTGLEKLNEQDREILAMRHYEYLSNAEAAEALDISTEAAYKRYIRALQRLKIELKDLPISLPG